MRGCDAVEVIRVGLALLVRRQQGTGHRGGAVLVPAAPYAEIDTNAPSASCAAAHCGVLLTTADRAVGSQYWVASSSGTVNRVKLSASLNSLAFFNTLGDGTCEADRRETAVAR